uniref:Peptidase C1A papain C-terminal domain-containing protein n=1 Tax=Setaria digitata TaxID=48799 RepID=A0A915PZJ9_9BILA
MAAFKYVVYNNGIDTEQSYPYKQFLTTCSYSNQTRGTTAISGRLLPDGDEIQLQMALVTIGPISVAFDASLMRFYFKGIFSSPQCSQTANHAGLAVGYGTDEVKLKNGTTKLIDYWLIKNSWSDVWGYDGYLKLARNQNNMCGIGHQSCYPTRLRSSQSLIPPPPSTSLQITLKKKTMNVADSALIQRIQ